MKPLRWLSTIVPILLGMVILVLLTDGLLADPVIDLVIDEGIIIILVTLLLTLIIGLNLYSQRWLQKTHAQNLALARKETAEEHRRFLNRLDHELKNPLTAIRAGLANLTGTTDEHSRQQIIANMEGQIRRLTSLVVDLRKTADIGSRPLEISRIDPSELLREALASAQTSPLAADRHLSLTLPQSPAALPSIEGDADLLGLALDNLLGNALKFTRPGDRIDLRGYSGNGVILIEVGDTGPGILPDDLGHIWEELYRGRDAQRVPGSSIGLALVQSIIQQHHGRVQVTSQPGHGTTFNLQLPLVQPRSSHAPSQD